MTDNVVPMRFNVQEVGKHVKSSKKRFTWEISLGSKQHSIVLDFSFISGKVKVTVDRKVLLENQLPANTSFQYPFTLDGNSLNVIQQGESFQLRINNKVFSHLYNQMKTNKQFKKYEDQVKDFKVSQNQFQAKKLTLNIGGVGGGMKKKSKEESGEGHNWNAFGGNEMTGFPNYFDGQSAQTNASTQKVEQPPQIMQKKVHDNLLQDSNLHVPNVQEKPQNILDFEAEIQNTPQQSSSTKSHEDFSTMQMMFQTMGMDSLQQGKPSVVIDNSEVDFFNNVSTEQVKPVANLSSQQQGPIDFFSEVSNSSNTQPQSDFNTMKYMFATNAPTTGNNVTQFVFNTSVNQNQKPQSSGLEFNWNVNNKQPENTGINLNSSPVDASNFSTLQGLFATNVMGGNQPVNLINQQPSVIKQEPAQNNFAINSQHFATQQLPTQGFGTSFNVNPQTFGTQNFMGQDLGSQQINFLGQQNTIPKQQPVTQPQQSFTPSQPSSEINPNDFSSMQFLFKTNMVPTTQNTQPQPTLQSPPISMQKPQQSLTQQFATTSGVSTQSPNTYGGPAGNSNLSFDLGMNQQQFTTSVNNSMMKKKAPETATNAGDLL